MQHSKAKWIIILLLPVFVGCKTFHAEIHIPAEPDVIWSVLTDETLYPKWHTVLSPVEGEVLKEGGTVQYNVKEKDGSEYVAEVTVLEMTEGKKLNQKGGLPGLLTFNHTYLLEPSEGGTRLIQHEEYSGVFLLFWDTSWIEPAYQKSNENLRELVINRQQ